MAAAYSMDLRTRVMVDADAGLSSKELAERYHVSRAWVDALKQRRRETGSLAPSRLLFAPLSFWPRPSSGSRRGRRRRTVEPGALDSGTELSRDGPRRPRRPTGHPGGGEDGWLRGPL